jgi:hypothetical protein
VLSHCPALGHKKSGGVLGEVPIAAAALPYWPAGPIGTQQNENKTNYLQFGLSAIALSASFLHGAVMSGAFKACL